MPPFPHTLRPLSLRPARPKDDGDLLDLARRCGARPLRGPAFVALRGRRITAAIALDGGRTIADPGSSAAGELALLRMRRRRARRERVG